MISAEAEPRYRGLGEFIFIAGPCVVESAAMVETVARHLAELGSRHHVKFLLKASFRKANRTSGKSFASIGSQEALEILASAGRDAGLATISDVHSEVDVELAARYVDVIQIPAFLCRQTDLIQKAARTGLPVNIKKGQFASPSDMLHAVDKVIAAGGKNVFLTERGTSFGYNDLVVDMRSLVAMRRVGVGVIFDATHSVQQPGSGETTSGQPDFILPLARAATAVGVDGVFFETHPDPGSALSDAATQLPLAKAEELVTQCLAIQRRDVSKETMS